MAVLSTHSTELITRFTTELITESTTEGNIMLSTILTILKVLGTKHLKALVLEIITLLVQKADTSFDEVARQNVAREIIGTTERTVRAERRARLQEVPQSTLDAREAARAAKDAAEAVKYAEALAAKVAAKSEG